MGWALRRLTFRAGFRSDGSRSARGSSVDSWCDLPKALRWRRGFRYARSRSASKNPPPPSPSAAPASSSVVVVPRRQKVLGYEVVVPVVARYGGIEIPVIDPVFFFGVRLEGSVFASREAVVHFVVVLLLFSSFSPRCGGAGAAAAVGGIPADLPQGEPLLPHAPRHASVLVADRTESVPLPHPHPASAAARPRRRRGGPGGVGPPLADPLGDRLGPAIVVEVQQPPSLRAELRPRGVGPLPRHDVADVRGGGEGGSGIRGGEEIAIAVHLALLPVVGGGGGGSEEADHAAGRGKGGDRARARGPAQ